MSQISDILPNVMSIPGTRMGDNISHICAFADISFVHRKLHKEPTTDFVPEGTGKCTLFSRNVMISLEHEEYINT
jgi:hypothetical protein